MEKWLGRFRPTIYAIFRIVAGLMFAQHGAQKLFGVLGGRQMELMSQLGAAGVIEFAGGLAIAIGAFTSVAAFLTSGQMAWAYFQAHAPGGFWPAQNGGELAVVYCWLFLYIAATGSGQWSVDALRGKA